MVPLGVPIIIRHLIFRVPKKGTIISTTTHMGVGVSGVGSGVEALEFYVSRRSWPLNPKAS